jgi:hypothetical protein
MERKLPVGIQDFEDLRRNGYIYVDKGCLIPCAAANRE